MMGKTWAQMTELEREAFTERLARLKEQLRTPTNVKPRKDNANAVREGKLRAAPEVQGEG